MANLIALANGNLTTSSSWGLVDTTSVLDTEAANTALTTSNVDSAGFVPGAITIDGFACKFLNRASSPSGTLTATLRNSTDAVDVGAVTINISDIPADAVTNNNAGWVFFGIGSNTLIAGKTYIVRLKTSVSSQVSAYRDATAGNWARMLRTTTTQAPAAADQMIIAGEWTAAATKTNRTITVDTTSLATSYGNINICVGGTLTWGTTASTNYALSLAGNLNVYGGGTYNMGTVGTPMPSTSSAILEFNCASNVQFGTELYGGTFNTYGNAVTPMALLAADAAAAATSLTTNVSTSWLNGDLIALAPTSGTPTQAETKALTANASGTTLTITGLTNAHGGNASTKVQGELGNLTRNVKIRGVSTTNNSYMNIRKACAVSCNYTQIYKFGSSTTSKRGISINTTACTTNGSGIAFVGCAIYDFTAASARGVEIGTTGGSMTGTLNLNTNVFYNITAEHFSCNSNSLTQPATVDSNMFCKNAGSVTLVEMITPSSPTTLSFTNNYISGNPTAPGSANGSLNFRTSNTNGLGVTDTQVSGNNIHSNAGNGVCINGSCLAAMKDFVIWRNTSTGFCMSQAAGRLSLTNFTFFGNLSVGMAETNASYMEVEVYSSSFQGGATIVQPTGFSFIGTSCSEWFFDSCNFGTVQAHSSADVSLNTMSPNRVTFVNCNFASTTELANVASMKPGSYVRTQKRDATTGLNATYFATGRYELDTTIYDTSPSQRLTPNSGSSINYKLRSAPMKVPVASGQTVTFSVKVRTSVVGDGAAYNGNRARLILEANGALGVTADTVAATSSAASDGAFETLSYTTSAAAEDGAFNFYVDCDGTAGWINVDTVTVS